MAGPWERYQSAAPKAGPWTKFAAPVEQQPLGPAAQEFAQVASALTQDPNPAKVAYDALPGWQKPIVAATDIAQRTADGLMFGFGDEIAAGIRAPFTDKSYGEELAVQEQRTADERSRSGLAGTAAELAGTVKTALALPSLGASSAKAGHGLVRTSLGSGVDAAAQGAALGLGGAGSIDERLADAEQGAKWGFGIGAAAPALVAGVSKGLEKVISPFAMSSERQAAVNSLGREGVETTAGQKTGSDALRYAESEIGGAKAADISDRQLEQYTRAALSRAGIKADRATPEVIDEAFDRIGSRFDTLASRHNVTPDRQLLVDLKEAVDDYVGITAPAMRAPIVEKLVMDIASGFRTGRAMDGKSYQSLTSQLERLARGSRSNPELAGTFRDMRGALDDAMERSIQQTAPKAAGAWKEVRRQYRNMLVIEDAATRAGENAALGLISPSALRSAAKTKYGKRAYARGSGDFAGLARAGEAIMKPLPNSGTAGRTAARNLGAMAPSIIGAGTGGAYGAQDGGGLQGALVGALTGYVAPKAVGRAMMSPSGQRYLANQLMRGGLTPEKRELLNRLLNLGGASSVPALAGP